MRKAIASAGNCLLILRCPFENLSRYDVRATLSDLQPYEAPPGGYSNRLDYLSPAEQKAEQLCEEERYYSLYRNEIEEEVYLGKMGRY